MRKNKKTSKIWLLSKEELAIIVKQSKSGLDVLRRLGFRANGGNSETLRQKLKEDQIDCNHFPKKGVIKIRLKKEKKIAGDPSLRKSVIWLTPKEELEKYVKQSPTLGDVLRCLGMCPSGGSRRLLQRRLKDDHIAYDHVLRREFPLEKILAENSSYNRVDLKNKLFKLGMLKNECAKCGLPPLWNGEELSLQMDHINGVHDDNRIENLRILCPNCHAQTGTFAGKKNNLKKSWNKKESNSNPRKIGESIVGKRKVVWPSKKELEVLLWEKSTSKIAKQFGVSDKAIERWTKKYNISKPPRGYWAKIYASEKKNNRRE